MSATDSTPIINAGQAARASATPMTSTRRTLSFTYLILICIYVYLLFFSRKTTHGKTSVHATKQFFVEYFYNEIFLQIKTNYGNNNYARFSIVLYFVVENAILLFRFDLHTNVEMLKRSWL